MCHRRKSSKDNGCNSGDYLGIMAAAKRERGLFAVRTVLVLVHVK